MSDRMQALLAELEQHVARAREHELKMIAALAESASWADESDRAWARDARMAAAEMHEEAKQRLDQGRVIAAKLQRQRAGSR